MRTRRIIGGLVLAGAVVLGVGGVALADPMGPGHMGTTTTTVGTGTTPTTMGPGGMMGGGAGMGAGAGMGGDTGMGAGIGMGADAGMGHMFSDVPAGAWYEQHAQHMAENGFMTGYADGTFGPENAITRGQFGGIIARMMGLEPADGSSFSDTAGFWGVGAIQALAEKGIVAGYTDGTFGPYDVITRAQMAAMLDRAWAYMHAGIGGMGLTPAEMQQLREQMHQRLHDVQGNWAEDHIAHMYQLGVVQGDQNGMFRPNETTNRAQASAMMWRWYEAVQG
ncbi:MAG: hypothetical protein Kow00122_11430 [Thermoleophilia bacterium]